MEWCAFMHCLIVISLPVCHFKQTNKKHNTFGNNLFMAPDQEKLETIVLFYVVFNYWWFWQDNLLIHLWENDLCWFVRGNGIGFSPQLFCSLGLLLSIWV